MKYKFTGTVEDNGDISASKRRDGRINYIDIYEFMVDFQALNFISQYQDRVVTVELTFNDDVVKREEGVTWNSIFNIKSLRVMEEVI